MKYILLLVLFTSCTIQKAIKKLDSSPIESSNYCATRFPQRDSIVTRDSVHFDTLYIPSDTVYTPVEIATEWGSSTVIVDTIIKRVCPPTKLITKLVLHDTTIYRDNPNTQATISHLKEITAVKDSDIARLTKGRNNWIIAGLIGSFLFLLIVFFIVWANTHKISASKL